MTTNFDQTMPGRRDRRNDGRFAPGDLILERYKVISELGQGGMGVVYKCFDETAGVEVALKSLPLELAHNTQEMEDIKENFQLVSRLIHQNIAISKTLERDSANGAYYLIMECVEGQDLRQWMRQRRKDGILTLDVVVSVVGQIADALDYAHAEKVIHRDIKPGNVMINAEGKVKILDFGLAAQIHTSMTRVSMAYQGTSGTGSYMAPEQWKGRRQGAAADQYALAVLTYEMLSGDLPFESADMNVLRNAVLLEVPERIPGLSLQTQLALEKGLAKEPSDRFASCGEFVRALVRNNLRDPFAPKRPTLLFSVLAIVAFLVAGSAVILYRQNLEQERLAAERERMVRTLEEQVMQAEARRDWQTARAFAEKIRPFDAVKAEALQAKINASVVAETARREKERAVKALEEKIDMAESMQDWQTARDAVEQIRPLNPKKADELLARINASAAEAKRQAEAAAAEAAAAEAQRRIEAAAAEAVRRERERQERERQERERQRIENVVDNTVTRLPEKKTVIVPKNSPAQVVKNEVAPVASQLPAVSVKPENPVPVSTAIVEIKAPERPVVEPAKVSDEKAETEKRKQEKLNAAIGQGLEFSPDGRVLTRTPRYLPASYEIPDFVERIEIGAFKGVLELRSLIIPQSVKSVGAKAFAGCPDLETVEIRGRIDFEGKETFAKCRKLARVVFAPGAVVEKIGIKAFVKCPALQEVDFPVGLKIIEEDAFNGSGVCAVCLPDGVVAVGRRAFANCSRLKKVRIPGSVENIQTLAFAQCENLKDVVLSEGVRMIGRSAFDDCPALEEIEIPNSMIRIESGAFRGCGPRNGIIGRGRTFKVILPNQSVVCENAFDESAVREFKKQ